jgi:hypothetical protein
VILLKRLGGGANVYQDGKDTLDVAIREYDQAVLDLGHVTASFIAGR